MPLPSPPTVARRPRIHPLCLLLAAVAPACKQGPSTGAAITTPWQDDFERSDIGDDYHATTPGAYALVNGALSARGAFNHPLWLRRPLPADVRIELDCWSNSSSGDLKVEFFGDGRSHARDRGQYTATGYVAVMGGWSNSKSILARGNEHGRALVERTEPKVQIGKRYHWVLERKGGVVTWTVDGSPFLTYRDSEPPLTGPGHQFFGFNNWEADTWFDDLRITPL
jgi:hypothetical protein